MVLRVKRGRAAAVALAALTAATLAGCGSSSDKGKDSQADSTVTVYSTMIPAVQERLAADFETRTGIKVAWTREQSSALTRRFDEESAAGKPNADVLTMNEQVYATQKAASFEDLTGLRGMDGVPKDWRLTDQTFESTFAPSKIAYSKAKFAGREDELPKSWKDLLNPRFKGGKILFADPRTNPELSSKQLFALVEAEGDDFLAGLAGQEMTIVASSTPGMEELAAGNGELLVTSYDMNLLAYQDKGAPIGLVGPFVPVAGLTFYTQIPKNAPHPDNAKKFVEYLFSTDGQSIVNDGIGVSPLGDKVKGSLTMPERAADPDPVKTTAKLPHYLDLLGIK